LNQFSSKQVAATGLRNPSTTLPHNKKTTIADKTVMSGLWGNFFGNGGVT